MKTLIYYPILLLIATALMLNACRKNDSEDNPVNLPPSSQQIRTTITGYVTDENGNALSGVTVTTNGYSVSSNSKGIFFLNKSMIDNNRCVLTFTKAGFVKHTYAFKPAGSTGYYVKIILLNKTPNKTVSGTTGGTVSLPNGASIQFQPNSFVTASGAAYTGTVNVFIKHLSPDNPDFSAMFPGGDLLAKNTAGEIVSLYSFGAIAAELTTTANEPLQLAAGKPATIKMPIASSQVSIAPATIPLWYFDDTTSLWIEEGTATKSGNLYIGQVNHFSFWNCDYPGARATIKGRVLDCHGNPLPNVVVTIDGWFNMTTDNNGVYQSWVPANWNYTLQILLINNNNMYSSNPIAIPPIASGQTYTVPEITVTCPATITGTIQSCNGENVSGYVSIFTQNNVLINYCYTSNGQFSVAVTPAVPLVIYAVSISGFKYQDSINPVNSAGTVNIGAVQLCEQQVTNIVNSFTITGLGFNNQTFVFIDSFAAWEELSPTQYLHELSLVGTLSPSGESNYFFIRLNDSLVGTYSILQLYQINFYFQPGNYVYYYVNMLPGGEIKLFSNAMAPGDYFIGTFSGSANIIDSSGVNTQGFVSGTFKVPKRF